MADIDLADLNWIPIGTNDWPFEGVLDGNGHVIKNLHVDLPYGNYIGLFGRNRGKIYNLTLEDVNITGAYYVGSLAGRNDGNITDCSVIGESRVYGNGITGGFVGDNTGNIFKSFATTDVTGYDAGGFIGNMSEGIVEQCYFTGNVIGTYSSGFINSVRGNNSIIRNCFSISYVSLGSDMAGFVRFIYSGKVENCYALSSNPNGFIISGAVTNCFFNSDLLVWSLDETKPEARTTQQMMDITNYTGWDFDSIWEIENGQTYPMLRGMAKPEWNWKPIEYTEIYTAEQLNNVRNDLLGKYRLMADIDLSGIAWMPIGANAGVFRGIFDGNGYAIKNMYIDLPSEYTIGLFSQSMGKIHGLTLENANVTGYGAVGSLVGYNQGFISGCSITGASFISGNLMIGGLVGHNHGGRITKSYSTVEVNGNEGVGGFAGYNNKGIIEQCYATGNIKGTSRFVGGLAGISEGGVIRNCLSIGNVVGGDPLSAAGFVGVKSAGNIENCYTLSEHEEGLVGLSSFGILSNSYFNNDLLTIPSAKPEARTTQQMLSQSNYTDWDFNDIWEIEEGVSYPTLRGMDKPGQDNGHERKDAQKPLIITHPSDTTAIVNESVELLVEAFVSIGELSYQWYENDDLTNDGGVLIPGAEQSGFYPPSDTPGGHFYYCVVTNTDTSATQNQTASSVTNAVTVEIINIPTPTPDPTPEPTPTTNPTPEPTPTTDPTPEPTPTTSPTPELSPTINPTPEPTPTTNPTPEPTPTTNPTPEPTPTTSPTPEPTPTTDPTPEPTPTADPTPEPTPTTNPTPEPMPTADPTPEPTPTTNPTPEPTPTADPTPEPMPTTNPTPEPTPTTNPTPEPMPTADPTPEPMPTADPTPEPTPTADPTPEPTPTTNPTPEPTPTTNPTPIPTPTINPTPIPTPTTNPMPTPPPSASTPRPDSSTPQNPVNNNSNPPTAQASDVAEQSSSQPEEPPNEPPSPVPSAQDEILVNGQSLTAPVGDDGAIRITFTESDIERHSDNSGEFNITVENHANIMLFISISALQTEDLSIKTDFGVIYIPNAVLTALSESHGDMLRLVIRRGSLYVMLLDEVENEIGYFNPSNPFRIILPYELMSGQKQYAVVAVDNNKIIPLAVYKDGEISINAISTGRYDVIYNEKKFNDTAGHWAENAIEFSAARALVAGMGDGKYVPDISMTRGMFVSLLARLDGEDITRYKVSRFADVSGEAYYMASVEWAAAKGIVTGTGGGMFSPDISITREEMVMMLYNYMRYKEMPLPILPVTAFADEGQINEYALEAIRAMQSYDIIKGDPGNKFNPQGLSTRAEASAIFERFIIGMAS